MAVNSDLEICLGKGSFAPEHGRARHDSLAMRKPIRPRGRFGKAHRVRSGIVERLCIQHLIGARVEKKDAARPQCRGRDLIELRRSSEGARRHEVIKAAGDVFTSRARAALLDRGVLKAHLVRPDLQIACALAPGFGQRESRLESGREHESREASARAEVERASAFGKGGFEGLAICALSEGYWREAVDYMECYLGWVGRLGGQIGARSPQGQGRGHFFDSFEKPVAQAERCFAEPPAYALARIAGDLLDIGFT